MKSGNMYGFEISEKRQEVWKCELEIFEEVKRICNKYNIRYFAIAGTLIGCVRDQGFIPWDDDIDLAMLRDDYEKFCQVAYKELSHPFFLQTANSDKGYYYGHIKIRNSDTCAIREVNWRTNEKFNQGIFLDIFPLDNVPDNAEERNLFLKKIRKMIIKQKIVHYWYKESKTKGQRDLKLLIKYVMYFIEIALLQGGQKYYNYFQKYIMKYNGKTNYVGLICEDTNVKDIWPLSDFSNSIEMKFEDTTMAVPINYQDILNKRFGQWEIPAQIGSSHGDVFFSTKNSYKDYLGRYKEFKDEKWFEL